MSTANASEEQNTSTSQMSGNFNVPLPFIPSPITMVTNKPLQLTSVCGQLLRVCTQQKMTGKFQREREFVDFVQLLEHNPYKTQKFCFVYKHGRYQGLVT